MSRIPSLLAPVVVAHLSIGCAPRREPPPPRAATPAVERGPRRAFEAGDRRLTVELTADGVVHVELAARTGAFDPARPIFTSPMVAPDVAPPPTARWRGRELDAGEVRVAVDADLCLAVIRAGRRQGRVCPTLGGGRPDGGARLAIEPPVGAGAYGLGQRCVEPGLTGGDWAGRERPPGGPLGNLMVGFDGGKCGDTQIPVLYAIADADDHLALFVDDARALRWDLRRVPWTVATPSPALRFYLVAGPTVADLRRRYMALTGRPPVPPRAAFGLWVSEYGYGSWGEIDALLAELRRDGLPVDGFVLDLQWFGGIREGSDATAMGRLAFDPIGFPDPAGKIAALRAAGVGVIPIEESYVGRALPEHARLAAAGHLVRTPSGAPVYLSTTPWWGKGGMIDWTDPAAGDAWHDWKRRPLVDLGVVGHWIDLGEPEMYDPASIYHGVAGVGRDQAAVHNLYNLAWAASIARGYRRQRSARRPFILSRSGTAGIQRHGVAMWSGDVAARYGTLAAQLRNQVHMAMSGIDYYGSDVGGFKRDQRLASDGDFDELYTRWLADAALTEVPLRPHVADPDDVLETSPARVGHLASNRAALALRYQLIPYLYALAHRAHREGLPVIAPLVHDYPGDATARAIGDQKLIGPDLMVALTATAGARARRVYLPPGTWFDFRTGARHDGGRWLEDVRLFRGDVLELPLYARAGAIIPQQEAVRPGVRARGARDSMPGGDLRLTVFVADGEHHASLIEDDGESIAYLRGEVRETSLVQRTVDGAREIEIGPAAGGFAGAAAARDVVVEVVGLAAPPTAAWASAPGAASRRPVTWRVARPRGRTIFVVPDVDVARGVRLTVR